jgi:hypothetical protein
MYDKQIVDIITLFAQALAQEAELLPPKRGLPEAEVIDLVPLVSSQPGRVSVFGIAPEPPIPYFCRS